MQTQIPMETGHFEVGIAPVADFLVTGVGASSDIINMKDHDWVRFILFWGVGAGGTETLTVESCNTVVPGVATAIPFWYRVTVGGANPGTITYAGAAGFLTTAGSNQIIELYTTQEYVGSVAGNKYVRCTAVQGAGGALLGGILIQLGDSKFAGGTAEVSELT